MQEYLLIIDVQFLIEARKIVQEIYEYVYKDPEDEFYKPKQYNERIKLSQFISESNYYAGFGDDFTPKTYVIGSNYSQLAEIFDLIDFETCNVMKLTTNNSPWNEAENIINTHDGKNILLIADNQFYAKMIKESSNGREVHLIRYKYDLISNVISSMSNQFTYQDITYPMGICLGLKRGEL